MVILLKVLKLSFEQYKARLNAENTYKLPTPQSLLSIG
ncbi:hypothetical protein PISS_a2253 [Pseudoalteromonas issachenkonii]|uniref:Uncharacterized protein n=1 Tax=Pseudoalteromonas issachenkonii TaxID=152297 RepID=A0ABN5C603_9GAMM|nr:hypothetical protein PSM_A2009 [Pseudoalteromonas sp. SM9913]ATC91088.1 hypothetical protein PISS_a2253 [Pseudoalteromonas issachenkonii]